MQPETPSHFRFEPSFSTKTSINRPRALQFEESSFVAFHQTPLGMNQSTNPSINTAETEMASVNVSPREATNQSMPIDMKWPLHQHPLTYAGTVQHDGSVSICTCRNCGQEHYNSAVYSCINASDRCVYHVCLACAMEQQSSTHKKQVIDQAPTTPHKQVNQTTNQSSARRNRRNSHGTPSSPTAVSPRSWIAPGAISFNLGLIQPINYDPVKFKKEHWHLKRWANAVERDADSFSMRLAFPCSFHSEHTLYFYPTSPALGDTVPKTVAQVLPARLFCDASQSELCASYDLNKHERAFYACSDCNYRLCMPCYRIYMMDLKQQVNVPKRALAEVQHSIEQSRGIDHTASAYAELVTQNMTTLNSDLQDTLVLSLIATVYSFILINAMITQSATGSYAAPLLNCVILAILSIVPSLLSRLCIRLTLENHTQLSVHARSIEGLYANPCLDIISEGFEPATLAAGTMKSRERELASNLYHHIAAYLRKQSRSVYMVAFALLFKAAAVGLLTASIVYLFVSVICSLPAYEQSVQECELRSGIPIGIGLFICLGYPLVWRIIDASIAASVRRADAVFGKSKENKRASKRARLDYV